MIEVIRIDRVTEIRLNRPEKRNALDLAMCRELLGAIEDNDAAAGIGAIVLSGYGPAFCAGMDLKDSLEADPNELAATHERLFTAIRRVRTPIVAAVQGPALAAGTGLAANAHIVYAAPDARFGLTEIRIGLWPVLIFRAVEQAIGERRTLELAITGRHFGAAEAAAFGLVTEVVDDPLAKARSVAEEIAGFSPAAISAGLDYADRARGLDWTEAGKLGQKMRDRLLQGEDYREGVAAFLEKRAPVWPSLE